ncbi:MAG: hypothetical protein HZB80_05645 [Deltaproteobacteria bacterium]|nr:hypothetical protein [Deltaproteobacteria bacterium]
MKKIASVVIYTIGFFMSLTSLSFACDFCILSQGISPLETFKGAGIRVNERYTLLNSIYKGTEKITNPGAKEEYWTTEITGFYGITENLMLLGAVPYKKTSMNGELMVNPDGTVDLDPMTGPSPTWHRLYRLSRRPFFKSCYPKTCSICQSLGRHYNRGKGWR